MENNEKKEKTENAVAVKPADKPIFEADSVVSPHTGATVDMKKIRDNIDFVRGSVYSHNPCFGALLDNLNFIYTFDVPTQATDGTRLFINPEWSSDLNDAELRFIMIHELMHCVFNHVRRGLSHNRMLSNIAADFEANGAAFIDKFVTNGQLERLGSYFSEKYIGCGNDLWCYENIYSDLKESGFIPSAPELDIIWPKQSNGNGNTKWEETSSEWKAGHAAAVHEINLILNDEYSKISKSPGERYTADELKRALVCAVSRIEKLTKGKGMKVMGIAPGMSFLNGFRKSKEEKADTSAVSGKSLSDVLNGHSDSVEESGNDNLSGFLKGLGDILSQKQKYETFDQGWDYCINESLSKIGSIINIISNQENIRNGNFKMDGGDDSEHSSPYRDPAEESLNLPHPPYAGNYKKLSKEDIISQQIGANIARKAGYKGEFVKEETMDAIENQWNECIEKSAGKEGSELITRHLLDTKASNYNWQHELRKMLNMAMNNSQKHRNEWGEKRGLARNTMTLKHKSDNSGMKDVVFLVDCSGSISDSMLSDILSECWSITKKFNIKDITYAYFTVNVELVETTNTKLAGKLSDTAVMVLKKSDKHAKGGHITGGTDFRNALSWVSGIGGARCVIMLTDGYDTVVPKPANVKNLIWVVYDNKNFKSADNSRVIHLDTNKMRK